MINGWRFLGTDLVNPITGVATIGAVRIARKFSSKEWTYHMDIKSKKLMPYAETGEK